MYRHKCLEITNRQFNISFLNLCESPFLNKLNIQIGKGKAKCKIFRGKRKLKKVGKLTMRY